MQGLMIWLAAMRRAPSEHDGRAGVLAGRALRWLAVVAAVGMVLILQQGTLVTNSGSAAGCGDTWPLCRGKIIPEFKGVEGAATLIEFSHRVAVPIESTLIIALTAGILWYWRGRREVRFLAPAMIVFLFLQAILGGMAVMWPTSAVVLAAHFGISLIAFAAVLLTAAFVIEAQGTDAVRDVAMPARLRLLIWGSLVYTYGVVYLGAYVRHVGASLSCLDWPLCNGAVIPRFVTGVQAQFAHRVAAGLLVLALAWLFVEARRTRGSRPDIYRSAMIAMVLVVLQALSGGLVVYSRLAILSTLLHSLLITLLFGTQSYMWFHTLRRPVAAQAARPAAERASRAAAQAARA